MLTGCQIRDARLRTHPKLRDLSTQADIDPLQLAYAEAMYGAPPWTEDEFARMRSALKAAGGEFIPEADGKGPGARLREPISQSGSTISDEAP